MWDRFGFNYENGEAWKALNQIMQNDKLELIGLHTHIGTYIMAPSGYYVAATKLAKLATQVNQKYNHTIKYIDMGGGFASKNTLKGAYLPGSDTCPSFNDYAEAITSALLNSELSQENMPLLILESGRALIDEAGYLIGTVLANKKLSDGRRSTIVDIGINLLFTSFWYEHNIVPGQYVTGYNEHTSIYGPLCMNIDIIRENILFPILKKGEHVVINRIGAYNMTQWLQFITLRPNIVMIGMDGKTHVIRENETNNSLTQHEHVPEHLAKFDV
jgi:diaminopimelate decarboxylase